MNQSHNLHNTGRSARALCVAGALLAPLVGCAPRVADMRGPAVIFLDGAGWSGSDAGLRDGLRAAGFRGEVCSFPWTSFLGAPADHFMVGHKKAKARELAELIAARRQRQPREPLHLMGLSAGAAVALYALEDLPRGVQVDNVVLFSPSISATYDLSDAMQHVRGFLYSTSSPRDGLLNGLGANGLGVTSDGELSSAAGLYGLRIPSRVKRYDCYTRVVNLPWRPVYVDVGWDGSHTGATTSQFVREVVAPRILSSGPQPLNRPLAAPWVARVSGGGVHASN